MCAENVKRDVSNPLFSPENLIIKILPANSSLDYTPVDREARYEGLEALARNLHNCFINLALVLKSKGFTITTTSIDVIPIASYVYSGYLVSQPTKPFPRKHPDVPTLSLTPSEPSSSCSTPRSKQNNAPSSPRAIDKAPAFLRQGSNSTISRTKHQSGTPTSSPQTVFQDLEKLLWLVMLAQMKCTTDFKNAVLAWTRLPNECQIAFKEIYFNEDVYKSLLVS